MLDCFMATDIHNASHSLIGYLYQCRQALLLAIEETRTSPGLSVSIERFDDVSFEQNGAAVAQIQTKHHAEPGDLTDAGVDLWKTLRIWSEVVSVNPQAAFERQFAIITTATAPEGSIAARLRMDSSTEQQEAALKSLVAAASSLKSKTTAPGREAFLALSEANRRNLVAAIRVFDNAPNITNTRAEIEERLHFAVPAENIESLVDHIEGWWFAAIIKSLSSVAVEPVSLLVLRQKIDEIAAAIRNKDLLLSPEAESVPNGADAVDDARIFVKQMHCVALPKRSVEGAVRDYYRATTQRSAWARQNVLLDGEAERYDRNLVDRWEKEYEARVDGTDLADDANRQKFGRDFFHWANREQAPFRNRHEAWLCSGSYQILADALRVGRHPHFQVLFASGGGGS
jgi:hypothetical protein